MNRFLILGLIGLVACACGSEAKTTPAPKAPPADDAVAKLMVKTDPGEALSVYDARADAPKDEYIVEGRIDRLVKGFAAFTITDLELDYCGGGGNEDDTCKTPWDYCCTPKDVKAKSTMTVEARGKGGKALKTTNVGFRLLDLVVVKGKLLRDEHGNTTLVATSWFRRERPTLPDGLHWPE